MPRRSLGLAEVRTQDQVQVQDQDQDQDQVQVQVQRVRLTPMTVHGVSQILGMSM